MTLPPTGPSLRLRFCLVPGVAPKVIRAGGDGRLVSCLTNMFPAPVFDRPWGLDVDSKKTPPLAVGPDPRCLDTVHN